MGYSSYIKVNTLEEIWWVCSSVFLPKWNWFKKTWNSGFWAISGQNSFKVWFLIQLNQHYLYQSILAFAYHFNIFCRIYPLLLATISTCVCVLSQQVLDTFDRYNTSFLLEVVATWKSFVRWDRDRIPTTLVVAWQSRRIIGRRRNLAYHFFIQFLAAAESICSNWWVQLQGKREWKFVHVFAYWFVHCNFMFLM